MGRVAVIGAAGAVVGYTLAGAIVRAADDADAIRAAWRGLPEDVDLVILTRAAAGVLGLSSGDLARPLVAVMAT